MSLLDLKSFFLNYNNYLTELNHDKVLIVHNMINIQCQIQNNIYKCSTLCPWYIFLPIQMFIWEYLKINSQNVGSMLQFQEKNVTRE